MTAKRTFRWVLVLLWLAIAVYLSRQDGIESAKVSGWLAHKLITAFNVCGISVNYAVFHSFLRKLAHFGVHLILAWLMYRALDVSFTGQKFNILTCLIFCSIIAVFDESIQSASVGRSAQLYDAILNLTGVQSGILLGILTVSQKHSRS